MVSMRKGKGRPKALNLLGITALSLVACSCLLKLEPNTRFGGHSQNDPLDVSPNELNTAPTERSSLMDSARDLNIGIREGNDIPFFWAIPKSGTSSIKSILAKCLNLRMASSTKAIDYEEESRNGEIRVIDQGGQFVNVDFGYLRGIQQAKEWNMASSGMVDVAVSSYLHQALDVFTSTNSARVFTIFRHPIQRMVSDYYYQKIATWEKTYQDEDKPLSLLEYATNSRYHVDNWVTRQIANVHSGAVTDEDFEYAKEFIRTKVLVLFLDEIDESIDRLLKYMNWRDFFDQTDEETGQQKCLDAFMHQTPSNQNEHSKIEEDSEEWEALERINYYDMKLYSYSLELFKGNQKKMIDSIQ